MFKKFLDYVEIRTKVASIIPFIVGTLYAQYIGLDLKLINLLLMFISMFLFDMCTTAINNYIDYIKERQIQNQKVDRNSIMNTYDIRKSTGFLIICILLILAITSGILLVLHTDLIVLGIGVMCFIIGILYTYGPIPISRMPLGEVFSGVTMGLGITFLATYIHSSGEFIRFNVNSGWLEFSIEIFSCIKLVLISIPLIITIANVMLANNICDLEKDIKNKRHTVPYYIGKEQSVWLFKCLYMIAYVELTILALTDILPITVLITLLTVPLVKRNIDLFSINQSKKYTFINAVKNLVFINSCYILGLLAGIIWI